MILYLFLLLLTVGICAGIYFLAIGATQLGLVVSCTSVALQFAMCFMYILGFRHLAKLFKQIDILLNKVDTSTSVHLITVKLIVEGALK